jgi:PPOX class probable F420-dependent enzyme
MNRRDQIKMSDAEITEFLNGRRTMNIATIGKDGRPHLVAMWYGFLDGAPAFWTYERSQKIVNLRRDPRVTGLVEAGETYDQLQGVELVGTGTIVEDHDQLMAVGRSVFERYTGPYTDEMAPFLEQTGRKRVAVRIDVERVVSWDHRKLGGSY